jgi:hypothetical protein
MRTTARRFRRSAAALKMGSGTVWFVPKRLGSIADAIRQIWTRRAIAAEDIRDGPRRHSGSLRHLFDRDAHLRAISRAFLKTIYGKRFKARTDGSKGPRAEK